MEWEVKDTQELHTGRHDDGQEECRAALTGMDANRGLGEACRKRWRPSKNPPAEGSRVKKSVDPQERLHKEDNTAEGEKKTKL